VRSQDRADLLRDLVVARRGGVQAAAIEVGELPPAGERVHDDRGRAGGPRRRHDGIVGPVVEAPLARQGPGERGEQRDLRVRCLRPDLVNRPRDLPGLDEGRHAAVIVAALHDHQRGIQAAEPPGVEHAADGPQAGRTRRDVAGPGTP
jgi:hypothetical protein